MDATNLSTFFLFSLAFLFHFQSTSCSMLTKKGFTMELIYRDSIKSPLYPGNLTDIQKIQRLVRFSNARALSIKSSRIGARDALVRPVMFLESYSFIVKLGIGLEPITPVYLLLDTGSSTTWTQIEPCNPCFKQEGPKYKPSESPTYRPVPIHHYLCHRFQNGQCVYSTSYVDGTYTKGYLCSDLFKFDSLTTNADGSSTPRMIFGCTTASSSNFFASTLINGILGMGRKPDSFAMQLASYTDASRFAYCMAPNPYPSYLTFGSDIKEIEDTKSTPLVKTTEQFYFVNLLDIALDGRRLNLPPGTFELHPNGTGGCVMDSGSTATYLIRPAYNAVRRWMVNYFGKHGLKMVNGKKLGYDLCYKFWRLYLEYPPMDFYFQGAVLRVEPQDLFIIVPSREIICLHLFPMETETIFGAAQQLNHQFVYDLEHNMLHFGRDACLRF